MFLATDNSTVESDLYRGASRCETLLQCIIDWNKLEMKYNFKSFVTHIAGTRMIVQGGDGLSQSNLNAGTMAGKSMLEYLPLHQGAVQRCPGLGRWIRSWCRHNVITLEPADWFVRGHDILKFTQNKNSFSIPCIQSGAYLWAPPPWLAPTVLEELRKVRIKRQEPIHIVVIPKLATPCWRRMLYKMSDMVLELPASLPFWPDTMHKNLFLTFLFSYTRCDPWCLRGTPKMYQLHRLLQRMWKENPLASGAVLQEFFIVAWRLPFMSRSVVQKVLLL